MNYWISRGGSRQGPYSWEQVVAMRRNGALTDSDHLWGEGWPEWRSIGQVAELGISPGGTGAGTRKKPNTMLWLSVATLSLLVVAGLGWAALTWGWSRVRTDRVPTDGESEGMATEGTNDTDGVAEARRPILLSTNAMTAGGFRPALRAFYEREILDRYLAVGHQDERWHSNALLLIEGWIQRQGLAPEDATLRVDPVPHAKAVLDQKVDDPLVLYLAARTETDHDKNLAGVGRARRAFEESRYPAFVRFLSACVEGNLRRGVGQSAKEQDVAALKHLGSALADGSLRREDARVFHGFFDDSSWAYQFGKANKQEVMKVVERHPDFRWLADYHAGREEKALAWKARGSGYASTVTEQGWRDFERHLKVAEERFTRAWKERPDLPWAAAEMIDVAMGRSDAATMRLWFDRSVAAQADYLEAYRSFRWGLRPRWHGSHAAMVAFGEAGLATGRYDTDVPLTYLDALEEVGFEQDPRRPWRVLETPEVWGKVTAMYEGYLSEPAQRESQHGWRSAHAVVAYLGRHYDDAHRLLEELKWEPRAANFQGWGIDLSLAADEVSARHGPAGAQVAAMETAAANGRRAAALKDLAKARAAAGKDAVTVRYLEQREAALKLEEQLASGDWVDLPAPKNLTGWKSWQGDWTPQGDGSFVARASEFGHLIACRAMVGDRFVIEGDVEVLRPGPQGTDCGIVFGIPEWNGSKWQSVRVTAEKGSTNWLHIGSTFRNDQNGKMLAAKNPAHLHIQVFDGRLRATVNGEQMQEVAVGKTTRGLNRAGQIGFGGGQTGGGSEVRYSHWKIRVMPPDETPR